MDSSFLTIQGHPGEDVTEQVRELDAQALEEGKSLWIPFIKAKISSTVKLSVNIKGPGRSVAGFRSMIIDGSPTIEYERASGLDLSGFQILGDKDYQNTVALKLGDSSGLSSDVSRSAMSDIRITRCAAGLDWDGWINNISNVLITWCGLGATLSRQNASNIGINYESNDKDFDLRLSSGVFIPLLLVEGSKDEHKHASTISEVNALTIGTLYTELGGAGVETAPWIHIGDPDPCKNIAIITAILGKNDVESLVIDKVDGFSMSVVSTSGVASYTLTGNASNVDIKGVSR